MALPAFGTKGPDSERTTIGESPSGAWYLRRTKDSVRIADENSLLITDIVVELENGCIANVEVQKVGYHFPGQRSACYSADLLLRQYKRVKDEDSKRERKFSYKDIKDVYTIVLYEKSPKEFKDFPVVSPPRCNSTYGGQKTFTSTVPGRKWTVDWN